ncbi:MAG TPA: molybdopterin-dependent oxidoreductase [Candidatus Acidoferrum sp.]|nr:molybdopterin-dependent oxidoreductase [Candidatus Acidoferrum sp.]
MSSETKSVVCCGCSQQCGILVHVRDDRIANIVGNKEHPLSQGFICVKGAEAGELHYGSGRIHWPLKRVGRRGEDKWQEIGWDQALDEISDKVGELRDGYGPETVAVTFGTFHGADWGIGERFLNLFGSPNSVGQDKICLGPTTIAEALTYGFGPTVYSYPIPDVTKCIALWGMRPSASAPLLWAQMVKAHRAGAKLVVIDPLRTLEARQADLWLQLRPGSDCALALGWLNVIIGEGLYNREFVERYTIGFDELAERTARYTPDRVAEITAVPEHLVVESARLFATQSPALMSGGNGVCQIGRSAVQAGRALASIVAITGNLDQPGANQVGGPPTRIIANGDAIAAGRLSSEQRRKRLGAERFPVLGKGYDLLDNALARRWYGKHHLLSWTVSAHEPSLWRAITAAQPYPVKALFVQHHNPLGASANAKVVAEALRSKNLELLVVHDLFKTPTGQLADYLLPASHWLEKPFFSTGYAYLGFIGDYAAANRAAIAAEFGHRSDYELWRDLGRRLGGANDWPDTIEEFWGQCLLPAGLTFDQLTHLSGPWRNVAPTPTNDADELSFGTHSGKIELKSQLLELSGIDPLPEHEQPDIFRRSSSQYPMVLTTGGRMIEGFHEHSQQMPAFRKKYPHPVAQIHPETAAGLGIAEDDWVRIETPVGQVTQKAHFSEIVHRDVVQADRWWYPELSGADPIFYRFWETNINVCTNDESSDCDPIMGAWPLRAIPCRIVRA